MDSEGAPGGGPPGRTGTGADLRLWPVAAGAWCGAGGGLLLAAADVPLAPAALVVTVVAATSAAGAWWSWRGRAVLVVVLVASAAAGVGLLRAAPLLPPELAEMAARGDPARVEVVAAGDPVAVAGSVRGIRRLDPGVEVPVVVERLVRPPVDLRLAAPASLRCGPTAASWLPGTRATVRVSVRPGDLRRGTVVRLACRGEPTVVAGASWWQRAAGHLRAGLVRAAHGWNDDGSGLLPGLVLGDTSATPPDLAAAMKQVGLSHLVAVSGENVGVVAALVLSLAAWAGLRRRGRAVAVLAGLAAFVVLVRPEPSVVRATAMSVLVVMSGVVGGRARGAATLAAAVTLLVLVDPWLSLSYGFALSAAATAGLVVASSWGRARLGRRLPRVPGWLLDALVVTGCAQVATAPLIASLGGGISLVSLPANLLAAPAVAPATVLGVVATVVAPASGPAAHVVAGAGVAAAWWIAAVARAAAAVPGGSLPWPAGAPGGVSLAVLLAAAAWGVPRGWRAARAGRVPRWVPAVVAAGAALAVAVVPLPGRREWPPPGWVAVVCDVGQGDAIVLAAGEGQGVLVDAGPDPRRVDRCLRDLGVAALPTVLLTHDHADHVEGLPGVLAGRRVGEVLVSPLQEPPEEADRVRHWAAAAGVPVRTSNADEVRSAGPVTWQVLWPRRILRGQGSDPNNASLVLLVRAAGVRLLLGGDVETAAQRALVASAPPPQVDVLKVPHHGSRKQADGLPRWSGASVAVVSVGAGNDYGHPAPATLAAYAAAGVPLLRTDLQGDLAVVRTPAGVVVVPRGTG